MVLLCVNMHVNEKKRHVNKGEKGILFKKTTTVNLDQLKQLLDLAYIFLNFTKTVSIDQSSDMRLLRKYTPNKFGNYC